MPGRTKKPLGRNVKGLLLLDYTKLIRSFPDVAWSSMLGADDLALVNQTVLPGSWYPIERMHVLGIAIFKLPANENHDLLRDFGRRQAETIRDKHRGFIFDGQPMETLLKFKAIPSRCFSFEIMETEAISDRRLRLKVNTEPHEPGARLLLEVLTGTIEGLVEFSGGKNLSIKCVESAWEGHAQTVYDYAWE